MRRSIAADNALMANEAAEVNVLYLPKCIETLSLVTCLNDIFTALKLCRRAISMGDSSVCLSNA